MHDWMMDNGETPHVIVDAEQTGVEVPAPTSRTARSFSTCRRPPRSACVSATTGSNSKRASRGVVHHVRIPVITVLGIYARETGEGMVFSEQDLGPEPPTKPSPPEDGSRRPQLKVVEVAGQTIGDALQRATADCRSCAAR